ncbi:RNA polymerase recycling motor ATPase HelR [Nocardioides sp. R-C-SC26]|uniref:RNA polymerase recycling motor ATPase HelR n=1 Tax=Nocardioides sp. R-C-SC26 TaxID=2870414 RepID=UPI001E5B14DC|nr:RNA polymerase recycling motor ATPase HelR [Nocardioides sp. R-C-SC26]
MVVSVFFALPQHLSAKAAPALIADDEHHLAAVASSLEHAVSDLDARLADARRTDGGRHGESAMNRDLDVHRLTARRRLLDRFGVDVCLGRMVAEDGVVTYVGRIGLSDADGERVLVDWRTPAAEPFFAATHARPHGLASRRRYRWHRDRVVDYWDEVFALGPETGDVGARQEVATAALDDQSSFIASLGASRTARMRDVLATIAADQDAIIRADSRGALVVDGGPGTGKTVVALHRAAYLLHADPRLGAGRGGVLVIGPHRPYLAYVEDVLPSLGEDSVRTCTLDDLVPVGGEAGVEPDPAVARLKESAAMVEAIEPAVALYEEPPTQGLEISTEAGDLWLSTADWAEAFAAPDPGTPHNEAREVVWSALVEILLDKVDGLDERDGFSRDSVRADIERSAELREAIGGAWPRLSAEDVVADLWSVPAYLRRCTPWLTDDERRLLVRRAAPDAWTTSDLPLLDAARLRLGDPDTARHRQEAAARARAAAREMEHVVDHLIAVDDSEMKLMSMLRGADLQGALAGEPDRPDASAHGGADQLDGPFAHVVIDEAQELTDAQWQMVLRRCPSRSLTIVGDRAQARHGFSGTWAERLARIGIDRVELAGLSVNYRTPEEVMTAAEPVIRAVLPDANVPTSVRSTGIPVTQRPLADLADVVTSWLRDHDEGSVCVIATDPPAGVPTSPRVRVLDPVSAKGLEFDLVVLLDPAGFGEGTSGAVDRYVAMTRATRQLVVLADLPGVS